MKKLLLLGAMLVLGATSFGYTIELGDTPVAGMSDTYTGSGNLELRARGNIIDPTNKVLLVVKPTISAGADGTSLEFDFGRMTKKQSKSMVGEFTAEVFKGGGSSNAVLTPVPLKDSNMVVNINGNGSTVAGQNTQVKKELYSSSQGTDGNRKEIGTVVYTINPSSGVQGQYTYRGRLTTEVSLGIKKADGSEITDVATGTFSDSSAYLYVGVKDLTVN